MRLLKLTSIDRGITHIRLPLESILDYYSYDESKDYRVLSKNEMNLVGWANKASNFLSKSKAVLAKELVDDHEEIIDNLIEEIQENKDGEAYTVINTVNNRFCVKESIEEIDEMIADFIDNEKLGL